MTATHQTTKPKFPPLESLTPEQLERLSKAHRKRGMKETANQQERKRLFRMANLVRASGKLKAKRLSKGKSPAPSGSQTPNSPNGKPTKA